ncbi:hypothetical protein [Nonomuraea sp. NPDC049758]|uniref:hypothetical protein n=1 Tax=Nonomuraea sp. NPDC049758 TaxID=3154360 RepID=UPI0034386079
MHYCTGSGPAFHSGTKFAALADRHKFIVIHPEDATLRHPNFQEEIKQWTNVHGLTQTPSLTDQPQPGWTRTRYGSTGTTAPVEAVSVQGASRPPSRSPTPAPRPCPHGR